MADPLHEPRPRRHPDRVNPTLACLRAAVLCSACASACVDFETVPLDLAPEEIGVTALIRNEEILGVTLSRSGGPSPGISIVEGAQALTFVLSPQSFIGSNGRPIDPSTLETATVHLPSQADLRGECGRCTIDDGIMPQLVFAGDDCPVPRATRVIETDASSSRLVEGEFREIRRGVRLAFDGPCAHPPLEITPAESLEWTPIFPSTEEPPQFGAIASDGTVALVAQRLALWQRDDDRRLFEPDFDGSLVSLAPIAGRFLVSSRSQGATDNTSLRWLGPDGIEPVIVGGGLPQAPLLFPASERVFFATDSFRDTDEIELASRCVVSPESRIDCTPIVSAADPFSSEQVVVLRPLGENRVFAGGSGHGWLGLYDGRRWFESRLDRTPGSPPPSLDVVDAASVEQTVILCVTHRIQTESRVLIGDLSNVDSDQALYDAFEQIGTLPGRCDTGRTFSYSPNGLVRMRWPGGVVDIDVQNRSISAMQKIHDAVGTPIRLDFVAGATTGYSLAFGLHQAVFRVVGEVAEPLYGATEVDFAGAITVIQPTPDGTYALTDKGEVLRIDLIEERVTTTTRGPENLVPLHSALHPDGRIWIAGADRSDSMRPSLAIFDPARTFLEVLELPRVGAFLGIEMIGERVVVAASNAVFEVVDDTLVEIPIGWDDPLTPEREELKSSCDGPVLPTRLVGLDPRTVLTAMGANDGVVYLAACGPSLLRLRTGQDGSLAAVRSASTLDALERFVFTALIALSPAEVALGAEGEDRVAKFSGSVWHLSSGRPPRSLEDLVRLQAQSGQEVEKPIAIIGDETHLTTVHFDGRDQRGAAALTLGAERPLIFGGLITAAAFDEVSRTRILGGLGGWVVLGR